MVILQAQEGNENTGMLISRMKRKCEFQDENYEMQKRDEKVGFSLFFLSKFVYTDQGSNVAEGQDICERVDSSNEVLKNRMLQKKCSSF